jgi:hypothetical protein
MANKNPYVISAGPLIQVINHFRKSFPSVVTSDTLKKLGYAKKNEARVINTLRFIGVISETGEGTEKAIKIFSSHDDQAFQAQFSELIKTAYPELFKLHTDDAWDLDINMLITFFRNTDQSTAIVGKKQAATFMALSGLAGHSQIPETKQNKNSINSAKKDHEKGPAKAGKDKNAKKLSLHGIINSNKPQNDFALTVRVEINLPTGGDQETYDRIFKSIKENLLNG